MWTTRYSLLVFLATLVAKAAPTNVDSLLQSKVAELEDRLEAKHRRAREELLAEYQRRAAELEALVQEQLDDQVQAVHKRVLSTATGLDDKEALDTRRHLVTLKKLNRMLQCVSPKSNAQKFIMQGCNLMIENGRGQTHRSNGRGNILVGYGHAGSGSHNLVVGDGNRYDGHGGLVVGEKNKAMAGYASVLAGKNNRAYGEYSSILGGKQHEIGEYGEYSTIAGGQLNSVQERFSSVLSGYQNTVWSEWATVVGGEFNRARAISSVVVGGEGNNVYESAQHGVVVGGMYNNLTGTVIADSSFSVMLGGFENVGTGAFDIFPAATDFLDGPTTT